MREDLDQILLNEEQIRVRLDELGRELRRDYVDKDMTMVGVLTGSVMFTADLLRRLPMRLRLDNIGIASYYGATGPTGEMIVTKKLRLDVRGRDVLVVDDILDTGGTMTKIRGMIEELEPRSLKFCVFLEKEVPHVKNIQADYTAFHIPNAFVVGYGLDYQERYRNLPYVATLRREVIAASQ